MAQTQSPPPLSPSGVAGQPPPSPGAARRWLAAPFHIQLQRLRWLAPLLVLALAALHQLLLNRLEGSLPLASRELAELLVYTLTGSIVAWLGLNWAAAAAGQRAAAEERLRRAYAELEARHNQLLTLHDLGQRVSAAGDEQAVLELAVQAPLQLSAARASTVVTFDNAENRLKLDMAWGLSEAYLSALRTRIDQSVPAERCRSCTVLKTHAESDCPLFDGLHQAARQEGIGSLICLPIHHEQERVGVISAYYPSADGPAEDQVRLLHILGGEIAAMIDSLRTRSRSVSALHALDRASETVDTLGRFAEQVLIIAQSGWDAQAGALFLYDEANQTWTCRAERGLGGDLARPAFQFALEQARLAHAAGRPRLLAELPAESAHGLLSAAAAPLISEGRTLGAIFLGARRRKAFVERHTDLLATMAHQTALAIRNAQLYAQVSQMAILEERYRLSREIHDGLAQTLGYLGLQSERLIALMEGGRFEALSLELSELRQTLRSAYVDVREAIDGLRLGVEAPGQIAARLGEYTAEFARQTGLEVDYRADPPGLATEPAAGLHLLRIAQEALTNVRKHAQARRVEVRLAQCGDEIELTITDDGRGFPEPAPGAAARRSYGLTTMRERAAGLGGSLTVATVPGQGTRISAALPGKIRV